MSVYKQEEEASVIENVLFLYQCFALGLLKKKKSYSSHLNIFSLNSVRQKSDVHPNISMTPGNKNDVTLTVRDAAHILCVIPVTSGCVFCPQTLRSGYNEQHVP